MYGTYLCYNNNFYINNFYIKFVRKKSFGLHPHGGTKDD